MVVLTAMTCSAADVAPVSTFGLFRFRTCTRMPTIVTGVLFWEQGASERVPPAGRWFLFKLDQEEANYFLVGSGRMAARNFKVQPRYLPFSHVKKMTNDLFKQSTLDNETRNKLTILLASAKEFLSSPQLRHL